MLHLSPVNVTASSRTARVIGPLSSLNNFWRARTYHSDLRWRFSITTDSSCGTLESFLAFLPALADNLALRPFETDFEIFLDLFDSFRARLIYFF